MADKYLLEDGSGGYLLEDGSGYYLLDGGGFVLKPAGLHAIQCGLGKWPGLHAIEHGHVAFPSYAAVSSFACDGVLIEDGEGIIQTSEFTDGRQITFTCFFKASTATAYLCFAGYCTVTIDESGYITVFAYEIDTAYIFQAISAGTYHDGEWHSLLVSMDTNYSAGNKICHMIIDRAAVSPTITDEEVAFDIGLSGGNAGTGSDVSDYEIAEVTMDASYIDFSVQANIDKFVTASNKPANIGTDGSTAYGFTPKIYMHIDDGEAAANFATNRGSGGDFTITGTLSTSSTSPSD